MAQDSKECLFLQQNFPVQPQPVSFKTPTKNGDKEAYQILVRGTKTAILRSLRVPKPIEEQMFFRILKRKIQVEKPCTGVRLIDKNTNIWCLKQYFRLILSLTPNNFFPLNYFLKNSSQQPAALK